MEKAGRSTCWHCGHFTLIRIWDKHKGFCSDKCKQVHDIMAIRQALQAPVLTP